MESIPTFDYYDSPIEIDGKQYMAHIRVKNTNMGDKYYGHTVSEVESIEIEPSTRTSASDQPTVQPVNINGSIDDSVPQESKAVKTGIPELENVREELRQQIANLDLDAAGQPLVTWQEAQEAIRAAFPDASEQEVRSIYRQYRNDTRTVLFGGHRLTNAQFRAFMQQNTETNLTDSQLDNLFHAAVLDTLDGTDALERYLPAEQAADQAEQSAETATLQAVEPGLVRDEYTQRNLSLDVASELDGTARLLGKTIRFVDSIAEGAAQGENAGSEIRIAKDAEDPTRYVYGHELGHTLKDAAPEEYQRLQTLIAPEIGDAVEEIQPGTLLPDCWNVCAGWSIPASGISGRPVLCWMPRWIRQRKMPPCGWRARKRKAWRQKALFTTL